MKQIISISLGPSGEDYEFDAEFMNQKFTIRRFGTDGDIDRAADLLKRWDGKAEAIGLGNFREPYAVGPRRLMMRHQDKIKWLTSRMTSPVTTGSALRDVSFEWSLRHIEFEFGNYFNNSRVLFLSGMVNYKIARVMSEFTDNLTFADPLLESGIPKFLKSLGDLELYAKGAHELLKWVPGKQVSSAMIPLRAWNELLLRKAMRKAHVIVVPYYDFDRFVKNCTIEDLSGKTILTTTAYDERVKYLKERGVNVVIDTTPKILERVVGVSVLEALIIAALGKKQGELMDDDLLELISELKMDPRVIYPSGEQKRINRFAYVIHPLSQDFFKYVKPIDTLSRIVPDSFLDRVEKVLAYSPPLVYSKVTGIKSPTGVEAEGWLITLGLTPDQMMAHPPEFTTRRLLQAAGMAKRLGAQILGLGTLSKAMVDAGLAVARKSEVPVTTGNSFTASGALWAAADVVRRMGLVEIEEGKKIKGKTMVVGATGAVGSICCRLLAKAFDEVHMVARNTAKLLSLYESILRETPDVKLHISTRADKYLKDMDVIVLTSYGARKILDIMKVKPGCVITDLNRPMILPSEEVAKRPDVIVIKGGEIRLPGDNVEMGDIGLPPGVAYSGLAETIALALEGRYEEFTVGSAAEWDKVREIYRLGLKHGMKLAAVSGPDGVYTDEGIDRVKQLALRARERCEKNSRPEEVVV